MYYPRLRSEEFNSTYILQYIYPEPKVRDMSNCKLLMTEVESISITRYITIPPYIYCGSYTVVQAD